MVKVQDQYWLAKHLRRLGKSINERGFEGIVTCASAGEAQDRTRTCTIERHPLSMLWSGQIPLCCFSRRFVEVVLIGSLFLLRKMHVL